MIKKAKTKQPAYVKQARKRLDRIINDLEEYASKYREIADDDSLEEKYDKENFNREGIEKISNSLRRVLMEIEMC